MRDEPRDVVVDIARYEFLRECENATARAQARADLAAGRSRRESAGAHMSRIEGKLSDAPMR